MKKFILLLIIPFLSFGQNVNKELVYNEFEYIYGNIGLDDKGLFFETIDCRYPGKWRLGGVIDENTGDKKKDKAAKKLNKEIEKKNKELVKKIKKEESKINNVQLKAFFGKQERYLAPIKIWQPFKEFSYTSSIKEIETYYNDTVFNIDNINQQFSNLNPVLLTDICKKWAWRMYEKIELQKEIYKQLSWKSDDLTSSTESDLLFYTFDFQDKKCREIGINELLEIDSILQQNIKTTYFIVNQIILGATTGLQLATKITNKVINKARRDRGSNIESNANLLASIVKVSGCFTRTLGDAKRLKKYLQQSNQVLDAIQKNNQK